jgi:hypothetical protein
MSRHRQFGLATQLFVDRVNNVVGHEWFPIVLSDVAVRYEAGLATQVTGEPTAVVVLHDDRMARIFENVENRVAVQRDQPSDLKLIRRNALL